MYPSSPAGSSRVVSVFAGAMVAALHGSNCAIVFADVFHGALCSSPSTEQFCILEPLSRAKAFADTQHELARDIGVLLADSKREFVLFIGTRDEGHNAWRHDYCRAVDLDLLTYLERAERIARLLGREGRPLGLIHRMVPMDLWPAQHLHPVCSV